MTRVRNGLTQRELDVISGWWHEGTVKGAAELLNLSEQTAKNDLRTAQSSQRRAEPFDLDGHGAPLPLEVVPLPLIDRLGQVERVAVTEVEPRPHAAILLRAGAA